MKALCEIATAAVCIFGLPFAVMVFGVAVGAAP